MGTALIMTMTLLLDIHDNASCLQSQHKNQVDKKASSEVSPQEFQRGGGTNDTDNNIR
jgi:hypothetical protein